LRVAIEDVWNWSTTRKKMKQTLLKFGMGSSSIVKGKQIERHYAGSRLSRDCIPVTRDPAVGFHQAYSGSQRCGM